jgi:hypothetical protein
MAALKHVIIVKVQKLLLVISSCILIGLVPGLSFADVTDVQRLISQEQYESALEMTEQELNGNSGNVTYRFLKGLILTRMDRLEDASEVFIEITLSNPDLPEPYNNLAVIYASQGEFDKAREYLQQAINTHPAYATAHENIGDIYAKLASEAYNHALELDRENVTARAKLTLVNDLFSMPEEGKVLLAESDQEMTESDSPESTSQASQQDLQEQQRLLEQLEASEQEQQKLRNALQEKEIALQGLLQELDAREQEQQRLADQLREKELEQQRMAEQQRARAEEQQRLREELAAREQEQQRMAEQQQARAGEEQRLREELAAREQEQQRILEQQRLKEQQEAAEQEQQRITEQQQMRQREQAIETIKDTVLDWSVVWMRQNIDAYIGHYSDEFLPGDGRTLRTWRQYRRDRLTAPGEIRILISDLVVELMGSDHAQATFTQVYESDSYSDRVKKTLLMKLEDNNWRITQELTR